MSTSMRDLISGEAELDSDSDDESFDEETGEERRKVRPARIDDSSEEEDDDDDEEEAAKVSPTTALCPATHSLSRAALLTMSLPDSRGIHCRRKRR